MKNDKIDQHIKYCQSLKAEEILHEAFKFFNKNVEVAVSFGAEDVVLIDMVSKLKIELGIFTIDTKRLNKETYDLIKEIKQKYNLKIEILYPNESSVKKMVDAKGVNLFYDSVENRKECCSVRKVAPLKKKLNSLGGWITGVRSDQNQNRSEFKKVELDENWENNLIKYNPLVDWSYEQVFDYISKHKVPYNKLHDEGYPSIGCEPCTRAIKKGEDFRSGRWFWEKNGNTECGLHIK
tara:strand:- start:1317 stop:2027 length:711 start_codon:yes stop_codon:yes gene_type:complete